MNKNLLLKILLVVVLFSLVIIQPYTITIGVGDSMEPTINQGDIIIIHQNADINEGDVVLFEKDPVSDKVIHRVVDVNNKGYQIQGDNNNLPDGTYSREDIKGVAVILIETSSLF